jgi:NAD(P)-dependent dehydrogenase (short-subunit alcohol dehydrogenase family)
MENLMRRWGDPRQVEVARIAAIVASQQFAIVTGNTIVVDDGTVTL